MVGVQCDPPRRDAGPTRPGPPGDGEWAGVVRNIDPPMRDRGQLCKTHTQDTMMLMMMMMKITMTIIIKVIVIVIVIVNIKHFIFYFI